MDMKRCLECGQEFPATAEYFHRNRLNKDGLRNKCKPCHCAEVRAWNAANPEKLQARNRAWYAANRERALEYSRERNRANPERRREIGRTWYEANRELTKQRSRDWYRANHERALENSRAWYWRNRDKARAASNDWYWANKQRAAETRRAWREKNRDTIRVRAAEWRKANPDKTADIKRRRRARLYGAEGSHSAADIMQIMETQNGRCWWCGKLVGDHYHVDHRIPLARGGSDAPENLVIACPECNYSKGAKLPHEWNGRLL